MRFTISRHGLKTYVDINEQCQVIVNPGRSEKHAAVNLIELTQQLQDKGLTLPVLVRFSDILKDRVASLINAFESAMQSNQYTANYTAVYPINRKLAQHDQTC